MPIEWDSLYNEV